MTISPRIETIASLIPDNSNVIDIGCDHAYLDIYLTLNKKNIGCNACDINKSALNNAINNIKKYNLDDKIKTYLSNGVENVEVKDNSIIVISGMGTSTILKILQNKKIENVQKLIIQSNNNLRDLRKSIIDMGYCIKNEKTVYDKGKYYVIIVFEKGYVKYKKDELIYGPIIIKEKRKNINYFNYLLLKEKSKYINIPFSHLILKIKSFIKIKKIMYYTK